MYIIKIDNKTVKINPTEKKILERMLSSPGKIFSREAIGKIINIAKERTVDVMITRLRQKIESDSKNPKFLQTIRGSGYVQIMPKGLFYRSLIIVLTPIILLQIIITIVFFDSLWIKTNKGMTRSLVGEIQTIFDVYKENNPKNNEMIKDLFNKNFDFVISFKKEETTASD